jgi:acyl carrier protein
MQNLQDRLVKVISDSLDVNVEQVVLDASFINDLGADSLEVVDLIVGIEEEFELVIPDKDAYQIRTVREALDYLQQRLLKTA